MKTFKNKCFIIIFLNRKIFILGIGTEGGLNGSVRYAGVCCRPVCRSLDRLIERFIDGSAKCKPLSSLELTFS